MEISPRRSRQTRKRKKAIARKKAIRAIKRRLITAVCSCRSQMPTTIRRRIAKARTVELILLMSPSGTPEWKGPSPGGSSDEPREAPGRDRRRVEPGRQGGKECKRPVRVVELVRRAPAVGEEQKPEPDLGDQERLPERKRVSVEAAGVAFPPQVDASPPEDRKSTRLNS